MTDRKTVFFVVIALATLGAAGLVASVLLQLDGRDAAQAWQFASTCAGALMAMLVSTRSSEPAPEPGTTVQTLASTTVTATDAPQG